MIGQRLIIRPNVPHELMNDSHHLHFPKLHAFLCIIDWKKIPGSVCHFRRAKDLLKTRVE